MNIEIGPSLMTTALALPVIIFLMITAMSIVLEKVHTNQVIQIEANRAKVNRVA